jgi:hypothetical protein
MSKHVRELHVRALRSQTARKRVAEWCLQPSFVRTKRTGVPSSESTTRGGV